MKPRSVFDQTFWLVLVGLAAWAVPGGGHLMIRQWKHALVIFIVISCLFVVGLWIGSIGVVDPAGAKPWYYAQILTSPAVGLIGQAAHHGGYSVVGRPADTAQIYTALAGLLNLLCVLNAIYRSYTGIGEIIGHEEGGNE